MQFDPSVRFCLSNQCDISNTGKASGMVLDLTSLNTISIYLQLKIRTPAIIILIRPHKV